MRHRFHALCPYFAMFPEQFAERWISELTVPGDLVLDPFCGRGTGPFQALLSDRDAVGSDTNPVASCISRAKTNAPRLGSVRGRITRLENDYVSEEWSRPADQLPEFFARAYSPRTLRQILFLRHRLSWRRSGVDNMLAAILLGALHGESERSPSYLSSQMPHTIATKPAYSIRFWNERNLRPPERDVFELLRDKATYRYVSTPPQRQATVFEADFRSLPRLFKQVPVRPANLILTSPPYLGVTHYGEDQWLRLWFLGGADYPTRRGWIGDDRYQGETRYWRFISDFWRVVGKVAARDSHVVIRIGGKRLRTSQIVSQLAGTASFAQRKITLLGHEVSDLVRKQTSAFRPGAEGCAREVDCCFHVA